MKVTFSAVAKDDLLDIAVHFAQDNPAQALTFVDDLGTKCNALGDAPGTAQPVRTLAAAFAQCHTGSPSSSSRAAASDSC